MRASNFRPYNLHPAYINHRLITMPAKAKQWGKRKAAPPALKPHGTVAGLRRTPKHTADPAGGDECYQFEKIVSTRYFEGIQRFLIRWSGYTEADDS